MLTVTTAYNKQIWIVQIPRYILIHTFITFSGRWFWWQGRSRHICHLRRWLCLDWGRKGWRWCVFVGLEVVYNVVSYQCAATKCSPVNNGDAEWRMEMLILWQLLTNNRVE